MHLPNKLLALFLVSFIGFGCVKDPIPTTSSFPVSAGDIVIANETSDAVYLLDSDGNLKSVVYNHINTENASGVTYANGKIYLTVDGVDRILAYDIYTSEVTTAIQHPQLSGTLRGLTVLSNGDMLIIESNNMERFNSSFERVTAGGWPKTNIMSTPTHVNNLSDGGFVACSTGTKEIRLYDEDGNQTASASSPGAGATNPYDCIELSDGRIAAVWNGTADTVVIYSSDLSSVELSYSDTSVIGDPRSIAQAANGNLLIADYTLDLLVELTTGGTYVRTLGDTVLNNASTVIVIPSGI